MMNYQITPDYIIQIDTEDLAMIKAKRWRAHKSKCGNVYFATGSRAGMHMLHRWLLGVARINQESWVVVDHKNQNSLDNRKNNLRICTQSLNSRNRRGLQGVYWRPNRKGWQVNITVDKQRTFLGLHKDFFEAACTRKSAENTYGC